MSMTTLKPGDKVKTVYGHTETVHRVDGCVVVTVESMHRNQWYHPSKVWKIREEKRQ